MQECGTCHQQNKDDQSFCTRCGTSLRGPLAILTNVEDSNDRYRIVKAEITIQGAKLILDRGAWYITINGKSTQLYDGAELLLEGRQYRFTIL